MIEIDVKSMVNHKDYTMNEAIKQLRTNIGFSGPDKKVIAFTSCLPSEGKSTTVTDLAISMAESGKRVLLIDADLRKSVMAGRMRIKGQGKGLSHLLSGQAEMSEVLAKANIPGLHVILSGPVPPNPAELLGSRRFEIFVEEARDVYDYVLIDTPPLGSVIDSAVISKVCDGVVVIVSAGAVSYKFAQNVIDQLNKADAHIIGTVLSKVNYKKSSYYGKYGGYGSYYGGEKK